VTRRDIPNLITLFRFVLIVPILFYLWQGAVDKALWLFLLAGASDGLDGWLARHFDWRTRLGGILDPLADKALMVSTFIVMGLQGLMPWLVVGVIILRDVIILAGAIAYHWVTRELEMRPSVISKVNTLLQIMLVLVVMWNVGVSKLPVLLVDGLMVLVFITTLLSGIDYVVRWTMMTIHSRKRSS
jgi:cardiolipin synthase